MNAEQLMTHVLSDPYLWRMHQRRENLRRSRYDRDRTTCIRCGQPKSPDKAFCSAECCKASKTERNNGN